MAGAVGNAFNGSSTFFSSLAVHKFGFKKTYTCILIFEIILAASIYFLRKNTYLYVICVCLSFICQGTHFSCFPTAVNNIFGLRLGGLVFSFLVFGVTLSSFLGFVLVNIGTSIPTLAIYIAAAISAVVALLILIRFDESPLRAGVESQKQENQDS